MTHSWLFIVLKEPVVAVASLNVFDVLLPGEVAVWQILLDVFYLRLMC